MLDGYHEKVVKDMRNTRFIVYAIAKTNDVGKKVPPMHKFWPLPGDDEAVKDRLQRRKQEYAEAKERLRKRELNK